MNLESFVGQTLDGKYRIERELGRGGMGAVYLATHIGTERPVAVKVIVPQFMQRAEFVERFRREARAAGRLMHPNVVDVTDFGIGEIQNGRVAYLVMEYLDGCTLGEILEEEKHLPLAWTLDILEQVSSAIHEAHGQGIIHRDLKPDNIWLEPNQRGGYTVKVLDFGIAKLETAPHVSEAAPNPALPAPRAARQTQIIGENVTAAGENRTRMISEKRGATVFTEGKTIIEPLASQNSAKAGVPVEPPAEIASESGTAIMSAFETAEPDGRETKILTEPNENIGTKIPTAPDEAAATKILTEQEIQPAPGQNSSDNAALTNVGAVLGTPLYMSPEQCRGERLDARSDIYSLGVIAFQMLAGKTPFEGNFTDVMQAHKESAPPALEAKKVPRKVKRVINSALSKNPAERPANAQAFISELRAQSEGIGTLLQRALVIYSEHLPKFLLLAVLLYLPVAVVTILQVSVEFLRLSETVSNAARVAVSMLGLVSAFFSFFCVYLIHGTTIWLVTQIMTFPLRPVTLRPALQATRRKWKSLIRTGFLSTGLMFLGLLACGIGFPILSVMFALVAPVVMMENLRGKAALKRSAKLVRRSLATVIGTMALMFLVPIIFSSLIASFVAMSYETFKGKDELPAIVRQESAQTADGAENSNVVVKTDEDREININIGADKNVQITDKDKSGDFYKLLIRTIRDASIQILMLPFSILVSSFSSIVISLLYLKTRQVGGESIQDLLAQFQETNQSHSNWQKRARERLIQSGRNTSRS